MTDPRILKDILDTAEGTPARRRQRPPIAGECPRCGLSHIPARPSSVRLVEWTDADGYHADLELCPDQDCPVWLHGSGPRAPLADRPHDEATRRAALEALLASIDEEDTEIYNRTRDLFEDPDESP